ncbi:MAG: Mrp/NBP35 family ATP-binding protein [Ruminococcaceae bacterium]|nr:Mrp/NBP35 family ATP-binding protein [Oscillospiraceae bacterium]
MSNECTHDCSSCSANCSSRQPDSLIEKPHELSNIKKVIGIVSGKGGVGKSAVTSMLAVTTQRLGFKTAILDADITGPSIPKIFALDGEVEGDGNGGIFPLTTKTGIEVMSVNLLLSDKETPVVWRGPVIAGTVKQFWTDVIWDDVDYMYIDMPPGTGDVPLTVFQSIPLDGIIIVTSPQELANMIVAKAVNMAKMMNIPVLGIVENMSYYKCPDCGKEYNVFGESHVDETAEKFGLKVLAKIPIDPKLAALSDRGMLELMENDYLNEAFSEIEKA